MDDSSIPLTARVYTDIQGFQQLKYNANSPAVKKEVAQQFEALLVQMVLSSMRNANKAFASELFGSTQMDMYQDIYDKQLSLIMSNSGIGFAAMVEKHIDHMRGTPQPDVTPPSLGYENNTVKPNPGLPLSLDMTKEDGSSSTPTEIAVTPDKKGFFNTPEEFVSKLWSSAKLAGEIIGANPEVLLAQAALETNWGKNIIKNAANISSYNLFNIKADSSWNNKMTTVDSLEQKNGILVKEKANFRTYDSFMDSFLDYVNFLRLNGRYNNSLKKVTNPVDFVNELQKAGYATDPSYADKIMKIFSSHTFQSLVTKVKSLT